MVGYENILSYDDDDDDNHDEDYNDNDNNKDNHDKDNQKSKQKNSTLQILEFIWIFKYFLINRYICIYMHYI